MQLTVTDADNIHDAIC